MQTKSKQKIDETCDGTAKIVELLLFGAALVLLAILSLIVPVFRFGGLHTVVRHWPVLPLWFRAGEQTRVALVTRSIERALPYCLTPTLCLRRAAATVCLLRICGLPAELVIGILRFPFGAHAWAEVNGHIIQDGSSSHELFQILERV